MVLPFIAVRPRRAGARGAASGRCANLSTTGIVGLSESPHNLREFYLSHGVTWSRTEKGIKPYGVRGVKSVRLYPMRHAHGHESRRRSPERKNDAMDDGADNNMGIDVLSFYRWGSIDEVNAVLSSDTRPLVACVRAACCLACVRPVCGDSGLDLASPLYKKREEAITRHTTHSTHSTRTTPRVHAARRSGDQTRHEDCTTEIHHPSHLQSLPQARDKRARLKDSTAASQ